MVTEFVTQKEEMNKSFGNKSLKKAASISNIRMTRSTFSLNNLGGSTRNLSGSQTSLNVETLKRHKRQSMSTADPREERRRHEQKQKRLSMPSYKLESIADKIDKVLPFDNGNGLKVGITPMNTKVATIMEENNADAL